MKTSEPQSERKRFTDAIKHLLGVKPSDAKDEPKAKHPTQKRKNPKPRAV